MNAVDQSSMGQILDDGSHLQKRIDECQTYIADAEREAGRWSAEINLLEARLAFQKRLRVIAEADPELQQLNEKVIMAEVRRNGFGG